MNVLLWANTANHHCTTVFSPNLYHSIQIIQPCTSFLSRLEYYHAAVQFWQETKYLCFSSTLSLHSIWFAIRCYPGSSLRTFTLNAFRQKEAARQKAKPKHLMMKRPAAQTVSEQIEVNPAHIRVNRRASPFPKTSGVAGETLWISFCDLQVLIYWDTLNVFFK